MEEFLRGGDLGKRLPSVLLQLVKLLLHLFELGEDLLSLFYVFLCVFGFGVCGLNCDLLYLRLTLVDAGHDSANELCSFFIRNSKEFLWGKVMRELDFGVWVSLELLFNSLKFFSCLDEASHALFVNVVFGAVFKCIDVVLLSFLAKLQS